MKLLVGIFFCFSVLMAHGRGSTISSVPDTTSSSVEKVVNIFFQSMRDSDSASLRSVLHEDLRLMTSFTDRSGNSRLHQDSVKQFIDAVGKAKEDLWDERISNLKIEIDGNLAQVWMDYSFYLNEEFSHCGVNAMQLFWNGEKWLIFQITDTRRSKEC